MTINYEDLSKELSFTLRELFDTNKEFSSDLTHSYEDGGVLTLNIYKTHNEEPWGLNISITVMQRLKYNSGACLSQCISFSICEDSFIDNKIEINMTKDVNLYAKISISNFEHISFFKIIQSISQSSKIEYYLDFHKNRKYISLDDILDNESFIFNRKIIEDLNLYHLIEIAHF